jgi:hypothetical protein
MGGIYDGFFARVDVTGGSLHYSSYLGGESSDTILGAAWQESGGNLFLAGATSSIAFPAQGPLQSDPAGAVDAFITKISGAGL